VTRELFTLNPRLDRKRLADEFQVDGRIQVRDVLTDGAARAMRDILARLTPWEIAWQAGEDGPNAIRAPEVRSEQANVARQTAEAAARGEYSFQYARYPMLDAYLEKWAPNGPHELLLEHINSEDFLTFIREVTGIDTIRKGDAQATLYAPGHFLGRHVDSHVAEGWRVAYVMNFCIDDWKPDWGGYLNFLDEEGDVVAGYKPRFNALNMFTVPRPHAVTYVPPFAPIGRFAITGWFRDR